MSYYSGVNEPSLGGAMMGTNDGLEFSSIEEQIQWEYDNKKQPIDEATSWTAKTRDQLMVEIAENGQNKILKCWLLYLTLLEMVTIVMYG